MKGLILSAGIGSRLRPLTYLYPKPMVKVNGKPILEQCADYLNYYGVKEIFVNLHYKPLSIMKYFKDRFMYIYENELSGEEGAIQKLIKVCPSVLEDYLVVMNGDTLTDLKLDEMFKASNGISTQSMDGVVYTGIKVLSPEYLKGKDNRMWKYACNCNWMDCGTFKGLRSARKLYETKSGSI